MRTSSLTYVMTRSLAIKAARFSSLYVSPARPTACNGGGRSWGSQGTRVEGRQIPGTRYIDTGCKDDGFRDDGCKASVVDYKRLGLGLGVR
jgi:hypothetical protein